MANYLVTGGAGFIGSHISEALVSRGHRVRVVDNFSTGYQRNIRDGVEFVDLTESNPTRAGFDYPADLLQPLADAAALVYDPHPFGLRSAREAVAQDCARRGVTVSADAVVLSASTSVSPSSRRKRPEITSSSFNTRRVFLKA